MQLRVTPTLRHVSSASHTLCERHLGRSSSANAACHLPVRAWFRPPFPARRVMPYIFETARSMEEGGQVAEGFQVTGSASQQVQAHEVKAGHVVTSSKQQATRRRSRGP